QNGEQPALQAQVVRRAVRTARAPAADSVSAAGDDGILMKTAPLEPRAAYELWADTYPAVAHNPLMRLEQSIVEPTLRQLRAVRALDVGTGSGRYLPLLRATGAAVVAGVDFSIAMLTRGNRAGKVCADACRLPFRRSAFDVVNASLMVGDIDDLAAWMR